MGRLGDKKANWILGGVCVSVLGAERHRQEAGECVRWAVDVIGRCNGPCLCPPSWTGAKNVCSHVRLLLFYQSVVLYHSYLAVEQMQGGVHHPFPPVVLGGLSVLPVARSDWLMFVELNFLLRIYTFRRARPRPESHPLCHWSFH